MKRLASILVLVAAFIGAVGCGGDGQIPTPCPAGSESRDVCMMCGPAGGCSEHAVMCAKTCTTAADCPTTNALMGCFGGVCQVGGCE